MGILEDKALPSIEIIPKEGFYDYENKYQPGAAEEICPAHIQEEWEKKVGEAALAVFQTIGLAVYARADFIVTEDGTPYFLEINTLPGFTAISMYPMLWEARGVNKRQLIDDLIDHAFRRYER